MDGLAATAKLIFLPRIATPEESRHPGRGSVVRNLGIAQTGSRRTHGQMKGTVLGACLNTGHPASSGNPSAPCTLVTVIKADR